MVMPGRTSQILETLPQRPPTPPKDSSQDESKSSHLARLFSKKSGTQTPPSNSPASSADFSKTRSDRSQKRVEWSERTDYKEPPRSNSRFSTPNDKTLRPLPSSENRPPKSILKPYNGVNVVEGKVIAKSSPPHTYLNFATMLESIVQQLAGPDRNSRIDAYLTLSGVLRASDHVPDPHALQDKMGLITQFIQRDLQAARSTSADYALANQAITLLASLIWKPDAAVCLSTEFCSQVIELAIESFGGSILSKEVVKHLMFIVGHQNFTVKVMTSDRVSRLMTSVQHIETHFKGRSIVSGRLTIYQKLLQQNKSNMISHWDWLKHLFSDMLSSFKDIQMQAISLALDAAYRIGGEKKASRTVMDLLRSDGAENVKYIDFYISRLSAMVRKKQMAASVPRIWTVVVLFLRSRPQSIEQWEFMKPWLRVIQECFNSSDPEVKREANHAWNRLVFAIHLSETTSVTMIRMLCQPLTGQMKRYMKLGRQNTEARQSTISCICNLLYYAFRPNCTSAQVVLFWEEYVVQLVSNFLIHGEKSSAEVSEADLEDACTILSALFNPNRSVAWIETRGYEIPSVGAGDLPSLDPRWVRKNTQRVFALLRPLLTKRFLDLAKPNSTTYLLWQSFVTAVASAGSKEVKVSIETMTVIARTFDMLNTIWQSGPMHYTQGETPSAEFSLAFTNLISIMTGTLGVLPFTQRLLSIDREDTFTVVGTPSHSPSKIPSQVRQPFQLLVSLMAQVCPGLAINDSSVGELVNLVSPFFDSVKSKWSRIGLARDLCDLLHANHTPSNSTIMLWQAIAVNLEMTMSHGGGSQSSGSNELPLGAEYRNVVRVLESGIQLNRRAVSQEWVQLFHVVCAQITREAGEIGLGISIIDPLAQSAQTTRGVDDLDISYTTLLINNATYASQRHSLDAARRRLWGSSAGGARLNSFDPFSHVYGAASQSLQTAYNNLMVDRLDISRELIASVSKLLQRCPDELLMDVLVKLQDGLSHWVKDPDMKTRSRTVAPMQTSVVGLWKVVCTSISTLPQHNSAAATKLAVLLCAGLESKHMSIVNDAISMWNDTFGCCHNLEYDTSLETALRRLRPLADIKLPNFPSRYDSEDSGAPPTFLDDSQPDVEFADEQTAPSHGSVKAHKSMPPMSTRRLRRSALEIPPTPTTVSRKRGHQETPERSAKRISLQKFSVPKLRHDDSQIQFHPIASSPVVNVVEESQNLTDRQKEVKERQQEDAAMFPDLRSSSRLETPTKRSSARQSSVVQLVSDGPDPVTPDFRGEKAFDDFVTSSPTPSRGVVQPPLDSDAIEPPSSPPERVDMLQTPEQPDPVEVSTDYSVMQYGWDGTSSSPGRAGESQLPRSAMSEPHAQIMLRADHPLSDTAGTMNPIDAASNVAGERRLSTPVRDTEPSGLSHPTPKTPAEIFLDAMSSPSHLSSPRATVITQTEVEVRQAEQERPGSAQYADHDESGMLRLIEEYESAEERGTSYPQYKSITSQDDTSGPAAEALPSTSALRSDPDATVDENRPVIVDVAPTTRSRTRAAKLAPSTIPETPDKVATSIPSDSHVSESQVPSTRRRTSARVQLLKETNKTPPPTDSKKRRRESQATASLAASDSQEVDVPNTTVVIDFAAQANTARPRKRGRPSKKDIELRRSQEALAEREAKEVELQLTIESQSQSQQQVDVDNASVEVLDDEGSAAEATQDGEDEDSAPNLDNMINVREEARDEGGNPSTTYSPEPEAAGPSAAATTLVEAAADLIVGPTTSTEDSSSVRAVTNAEILSRFQALVSGLKGVTLSREEAKEIDTLMWDLKGEVCEAERRGRRVKRGM